MIKGLHWTSIKSVPETFTVIPLVDYSRWHTEASGKLCMNFSWASCDVGDPLSFMLWTSPQLNIFLIVCLNAEFNEAKVSGCPVQNAVSDCPFVKMQGLTRSLAIGVFFFTYKLRFSMSKVNFKGCLWYWVKKRPQTDGMVGATCSWSPTYTKMLCMFKWHITCLNHI